MSRPRRTLEDLRQALRGIGYETDIMRRTAYALASGVLTGGSLQQIAFLESFLVHVRNLLEFVAPQRSAAERPETVISRDFFSGPDHWQGDSTSGECRAKELFEGELKRHKDWAECDLHEFRRKLNTKLAHVSYSNRDQTKWPVILILKGVEKALDHFEREACEHGIDGVFGNSVTAYGTHCRS